MSFDIGDQRKAKKKDPLDMNLSKDFDLFIQEGNVFDVKDKSRKLKKFIPKAPDDGLNQSFDADNFGINSKKTSDKITRRFFDF